MQRDQEEVLEAKKRFNSLVKRFEKADEYYKKYEKGEMELTEQEEKKAYITLSEILYDITVLTKQLKEAGVKITAEEFKHGFKIKGG